MVEVVKIPKKFRDICDLIRNGKTQEGIAQLEAYNKGLENQKKAVLAEVAYFEGRWEEALQYDIELLPYWGEWHYGNLKAEHLSAMSFVAKKLGKEQFLTDILQKRIQTLMQDTEMEEHIRDGEIVLCKNKMEFLKTGIVPYFTKKETYTPPQELATREEIIAEVKARHKKIDIENQADKNRFIPYFYEKAKPEQVLELYDEISPETTLTHLPLIQVLSICNYLNHKDKAKEIILRMARQKMWYVASPTQVRPMEFFTHPSIFAYLEDKAFLKTIVQSLESE